MENSQFAITFKGNDFAAVVAQAKNFVTVAEQFAAGPMSRPTAGVTAKSAGKTAKPKAAAAPEMDDEETTEDAGFTDTEEETNEGLSFDSQDDEEITPPKKAAKKAPKITDKDINSACLAHAKAHGRPKTLAILSKKFGVKSILELKTEQYADVLKALKV